ncbi:nucleoside monophosphate kinase [Candidatus Daviesbacteria bacterium]|nr:nucleoside monophosphate kinase [Candidatus Daviesbacteria bacterium]
MKVLLIGPQGSGKSTQGRFLAQYLQVPYISTGEIFRKLSQEKVGFGQIVKTILEEGHLVDDKTTYKIVKDRLSQPDCKSGFVMDGYPRNMEQLRLFDPKFDRVIYLDVPEKEVMRRLMGRGRSDDAPKSIKTRLDLYYRQTRPLLDYYRKQGILVEVEGMGDIQTVQNEIKKFV